MPQIDIDHIIQELMDMHRQLYSKDTTSSAFVLARLMPSMNQEAWTTLCDKVPSVGWCALEINNNVPTIQAPMPVCMASNAGEMLAASLLSAAFMQYLEAEVARCTRTNSSLSLVHFAQVTSPKKSFKDTTFILQKAVHKFGGSCDVMGPIDKEHIALILPGAKVFKAQNMVEDVVEFCKNEGLLLKGGIAEGAGKYSAKTLMEQANIALKEALEHSQAVRIYQKAGANMDATLVQSHEKRFLFSGSE